MLRKWLRAITNNRETNERSVNQLEKLELFSVYDSKVEGYLPPFSSNNKAVAIRQFETAVLREGADLYEHCEDYSLWHVGQFDPDKGLLISNEMATVVVQAHQIVSKNKNQQEMQFDGKV